MTLRPVTQLRLGEIGDVPGPAVRDILRTIVLDAPLTADARTLLTQACGIGAGAAGLDPAIRRMLPMLVGRAAYATLDPSTRQQLRSLTMRNTVRFAALEQQAFRIARTLLDAGITPLFLKGFALAASIYPRPSDRPMGDLDLAVPAPLYDRAIEVLGTIGLVEGPRDPAARPGVNGHAQMLHDPGGMTVMDLHYHVLGASIWAGADDRFWRRAVPLPINGGGGPVLRGALTLAPEDHLLHACLHGYSRIRSHSLFRWITDSMAVIRVSGDAFRWDVLVDEANQQRCGPLMAASLRYLAEEFDLAVPPTVLQALPNGPAHFYDIGYFRATSQRSRSGSPWLRFAQKWYACQRQANRALWSPLAFGRVLAWHWGCASIPELLWQLIRRRRDPDPLSAGRRPANSI